MSRTRSGALVRWSAIVLALAAAMVSSGCSTIGYYVQAVQGHLDVMHRARPIAEKLARPETPQALRERLARVLVMRDFASRELALPDNGSYRAYADLERPFVLWNVFATPEFSVQPAESCFPFAGCVTYRGFYSEERARRYADELGARGFDTFVGGVPAYSTLGYFDDPVLNTFVRAPEPEVARLIFHELAHQTVYARGDTVFNESFATAVEEEGMRRWLEREGSPAQREAWAVYQSRRRAFVALVSRYRERLAERYAAPDFAFASPIEKRAEKARIFQEMRRDYEALKTGWGGFAGYDRYFNREPNNALLAVVAAYTQWVPAFSALIGKNGGDLAGFYAQVLGLSRLSQDLRAARLRSLMPPGAFAGSGG
jgi:predicted aminopeptidase